MNMPATINAPIGAVFTPLQWGRYFTRTFHIAEQWLKGATLFDPTMGDGQLLEAVIIEALKITGDKDQLPLHRLFGCEINKKFYQQTFRKFKQKYDIELPQENFYCQDFLSLPPTQEFDIIFANPPWSNFTDLPPSYKEFIKDKFLHYGLVTDKRNLLWGGSRIDIAALVIQKAMAEHLSLGGLGGRGYFFMPLSLLLNDGAHADFRRYRAGDSDFRIEVLYDFSDGNMFPGVATRCGFMAVHKGEKMRFPTGVQRWEGGEREDGWESCYGHAMEDGGAWLLSGDVNFSVGKIAIDKVNRPRQGVNSCGANDIYFFDSLKDCGDGNVVVCNKSGEFILPRRYMYPVMVADNFREGDDEVRRWVFLPYGVDGKVLSLSAVMDDEVLWSYLCYHEERLRGRRGVMIGSLIGRGLWWGLLGVGDYNFARYRVAWEAYGRDYFTPRLFGFGWQANQSLQAFMPFGDLGEAQRVLGELGDGRIEKYLLAHGMGGTMGWAQPGRIKKFLNMQDDKTEKEKRKSRPQDKWRKPYPAL